MGCVYALYFTKYYIKQKVSKQTSISSKLIILTQGIAAHFELVLVDYEIF